MSERNNSECGFWLLLIGILAIRSCDRLDSVERKVRDLEDRRNRPAEKP